MDADNPRREDDLKDVATRLSAWRPTAEGLNADAALFAAGLAAGRRGRGRIAPLICGLTTILAVCLAIWGLTERSERQALASRLREHLPDPSAYPARVADHAPESSYASSPDDYLHLSRRMERDPVGSLVSSQHTGPLSEGPPPPQPTILTPLQRDRLLE